MKQNDIKNKNKLNSCWSVNLVNYSLIFSYQELFHLLL